MGSRTYLSLPCRPLPNRRNVVLTHRDAALFEGAEVVRNIEDILALNKNSNSNTPIIPDDELFIIGGGQVYEQLLPFSDKLYITRIHHTFPDADTFFPAIDPTLWQLVSTEYFPAADNNPYDYSFEEYNSIR